MLCRTVLIFLVLISTELKAQGHLFSDISDTPETISASHILAHNIRAIGFRYFWATQDLTAQDLEFRPSEGARSTQETLEHLYGLATMIASAVEDEIFQRPTEQQLWPFSKLREQTITLLEAAYHRALKLSDEDLQRVQIRFQSASGERSFPIWNLIHGPLADAQYHIGQLVSFRRSSGNPIDPKLNVFLGTKNN